MTLYDVLGVGRNASAVELRKAYLARARRSHPDFHTGSDAGTQAAADREMRRLNEAWAVLGDPDRRRDYDRELRAEELRNRPPGAPSPDFVPYVDDDTDYSALLDDAGPGRGARLPRWVQLLPAGLLLVAIGAFSVGLVASVPGLLAVGVLSLVLSGLSFLLAPALAVMRSLDDDPDSGR